MNRLAAIFKRSSLSDKLMLINVGVFIAIKLLSVLFRLFNFSLVGILPWLETPSSPVLLLKQPWSIITYAFLHVDFFHILFNMLWLYWFGRIFLTYFTGKQMVGVYLLGAVAGAATFILAYNVFPYFTELRLTGYLLGASAAVMAIVFAAAVYNPDLEIQLLLLGRIKLIWLAIVTFLIDILSVTSANAGGHFAHIGGALFGIFFALQYRKGRDLSDIVNKPLDHLVALFPKRRDRKNWKVYKKENIDWEYNEQKNRKTAEIDTLLEKIKRSGYGSLTKEEKQKLFDAGNK